MLLVDDQFVIQVRFAIRSAGQVRPHLIMKITEKVSHVTVAVLYELKVHADASRHQDVGRLHWISKM